MKIEMFGAAALALFLFGCGPQAGTQSEQQADGGAAMPEQPNMETPQAAAPVEAAPAAAAQPQPQGGSSWRLPPPAVPTVTDADWDQMVLCSYIYQSLEYIYGDYFGNVVIPPPPANQYTLESQQMQRVINAQRDASNTLGEAASKLGRQNDWMATQGGSGSTARVYADVPAKTAECDRKFGFQVATILPPLKPYVPKPTSSLAMANASAASCEALAAINQALADEVAYIRSERVRLGDPNIYSTRLSRSQAGVLTMDLNGSYVGRCGPNARLAIGLTETKIFKE